MNKNLSDVKMRALILLSAIYGYEELYRQFDEDELEINLLRNAPKGGPHNICTASSYASRKRLIAA